VPSSEITAYMNVMQVKGACTGNDIAGYVAGCLSQTSTSATCGAWFNGDASTACQNCLVGPTTTQGDAQVPTGQGGVWFWQGLNLGSNFPGCLALEGATACAQAYAQLDECFVAAGCGDCTTSTVMACEQTIFGTGGACASYYAPYKSACPQSDFADGGVAGPGGACSDDQAVLSVICGNGTGDGG
jgi:hypothetical protein